MFLVGEGFARVVLEVIKGFQGCLLAEGFQKGFHMLRVFKSGFISGIFFSIFMLWVQKVSSLDLSFVYFQR